MNQEDKPVANFSYANGNVFNLMGIAKKALRSAGLHEEATEMLARVQASGSYDEALAIMNEYVDVQ
jgi:hypothetical protein